MPAPKPSPDSGVLHPHPPERFRAKKACGGPSMETRSPEGCWPDGALLPDAWRTIGVRSAVVAILALSTSLPASARSTQWSHWCCIDSEPPTLPTPGSVLPGSAGRQANTSLLPKVLLKWLTLLPPAWSQTCKTNSGQNGNTACACWWMTSESSSIGQTVCASYLPQTWLLQTNSQKARCTLPTFLFLLVVGTASHTWHKTCYFRAPLPSLPSLPHQQQSTTKTTRLIGLIRTGALFFYGCIVQQQQRRRQQQQQQPQRQRQRLFVNVV